MFNYLTLMLPCFGLLWMYTWLQRTISLQVIFLLFAISGYSYNKKLPLNSTRNFEVEGFEVCKPLKLTYLMKM